MADWDVNLELVDNKSSKFWRARIDGGNLHINYGRIGTNGATQLKELGGESRARAELDKLARSKRKKGYSDAAGAGATEAQQPAPEAAPQSQSVSLSLDESGRKLNVTLDLNDAVVRTVAEEHYGDAAEANAALARIVQALKGQGYRVK